MPAKEILAKLGARWKALDDEDKEKYNKLSSDDKIRYQEEMKNYIPKEDEEPKEKKKAAPKKQRKEKEQVLVIDEEDEEEKKSNEDIVKEIVDNFEGDTVTKKAINEELKKRGVEIGKDELNKIIAKLNE